MMQPETAFWLLAATAQAAAALAGLSAVVLVFQFRLAGEGWDALEKERNPTRRAITAKAWLGVMRAAGLAALSSLYAVGLSLLALPWVEPGAPAVPLVLVVMALVAVSLALLGGSALGFAVAVPMLFYISALQDVAGGMTWRQMLSNLRGIQAKDIKRAEAAWGSSKQD